MEEISIFQKFLEVKKKNFLFPLKPKIICKESKSIPLKYGNIILKQQIQSIQYPSLSS